MIPVWPRTIAALTITFTLTGFTMTPNFKPEQATRSKSFQIALPSAQAYNFFTPEGEKQWAEGWSPRYLNSPDGNPRAGLVFTTTHGVGETIWTMTRHEPESGIVEYVRTTPGAWHAIIRVALRASSDAATEVTVAYQYTALSEDGNAYIRNMDTRQYAKFIGEWESEISRALLAKAPKESVKPAS
ncbi:MAG: hypothetical protein ABL931_10685 [Usitatibacteraceae bacterium]